jgi:putative ABC transport system permease protein
MLDTLRHDVTHAARALRRTAGFTATAIITLALGIGATSAIFTMVNAALLKPLPYPEPGRVLVLGAGPNGAQPGQLFLYLRERSRRVQHVAAQRNSNGWNLVAGDVATYVTGLQVSTGYFDALGVSPLIGRGFTRAETAPNGPQAVVISEALWRRVFAGRPDAIGQPLQLGGVTHTIVGVVPEGFRSIPGADVWTPLRTSASDNSFNYRVIGRLADDATVQQAQQEFGALRADIQREFPRTNERRLAATTWVPLRDLLAAPMRTPLLVLLGAVTLVLLIACVNVAGLQLTRALSRRRELATRAALGASRTRLARPAIAESVLLGVAGAAGGLVIAIGLSRVLIGLVSADAARLMLSGETLQVDWRVFGFTLAAALTCSLVFGIAPALLSTRVDVRLSLTEGITATASRRTVWLRRMLAVAELALAAVLLVGAGLLVRTLWNLTSAEPGFVSTDVVVGRMSLQGSARDSAELSSVLDRGLERIRRLDGVIAAAASNGVPIERPYNIPLEPLPGSRITEPLPVDWRYVTPDYFAVFGIRQLAGRMFDARDHTAAEPVAIVNETLARVYFGRADVVGETIGIFGSFQDPLRRIVGVVADVKALSNTGFNRGVSALGAGAAPMLFTPAAQASATLLRSTHAAFPMTWSIRTDGRRAGLEREIEDALRTIDPRLPFIGFEPMSAVVSRDLDVPRFLTTLLAAFAGLAAALAAIGLYGLMTYAGSQRVREIGIRMAFGANSARVLRHFMREGLAVAATGLAAGTIGAALLTNAIAAYLFGVTPLDAPTFLAALVLLLATAALASFVPAWRAARIDPVRALKAQ